MVSDGVTFFLPQEGFHDGLDELFVARFPCILVQPEKTHLAAHVAHEWQACVEWLRSSECDSDQAYLIEMLHVAGEHMSGQVSGEGLSASISRQEAKSAIHGRTESTPIYGMLLHLAVAQADPELIRSIRPLAAQLLLAHATLIYLSDGEAIDLCQDEEAAKSPVPSSVPACRLVRQLAIGRHSDLAKELPVERVVFPESFDQLKSAQGDATTPYHEPLKAACVTIGDARERRKSRRSRLSSKREPAHDPSPGGGRAPDTDAGQAEDGARGTNKPRPSSAKARHRWARTKARVASGEAELPTSALSDEDAQEFERHGLSAREIQPTRTTLRSSTVKGERPGASLSMRIRCEPGMLKDRARTNQGLPIDPKAIRREEVAVLVKKLWKGMSEDTVNSSDEAAAEAVAMLALVLATGASPEELHSITVMEDETTIPEDHARAFIISKDRRLHLWVRVPAPEMDPELYAGVANLLKPISEGLFLPLPEPLVTSLKTVRKKAGTLGKPTLFSTPLDEIRKAAEYALRKVNERHHTRLRLSRLPFVLPQWIADHTGNWSYAWILSGDGDPHAHTPLVYQTTPASTLVTIYQRVLAKIFDVPGTETPGTVEDESEMRHFGSALRTRNGVWQRIATELKGLIPPVPRRDADADTHIGYHNAYVLYTSIMALVGTGMRAIRDPVESVLDIDWEHGLLYAQDKETHARANQRIIPLAPSILGQLRAYRRHLQALAERMVRLDRNMAATLRAADSGENPKVPFLLFFLDQDGEYQGVRPGTLAPRLRNLFPAPINLGRHHLRSHLTEAGCPGEWIDALMGHEPTGMEAFGAYSALGIQDMQRMAEQWIEPMLQEHGWTVVQGVPA